MFWRNVYMLTSAILKAYNYYAKSQIYSYLWETVRWTLVTKHSQVVFWEQKSITLHQHRRPFNNICTESRNNGSFFFWLFFPHQNAKKRFRISEVNQSSINTVMPLLYASKFVLKSVSFIQSHKWQKPESTATIYLGFTRAGLVSHIVPLCTQK